MSGAMRRCPQTRVRAQRRTLRAGRAPSSSADCPELKRARSLGWPDHDQPMRWRTYDSRPNGRVLSKGFSTIGPAPPSERAPNESLQPRAAGAALLYQRPKRTMTRRTLSEAAVEHPLHPELVGQFPVIIAPRLHGERGGDAAAQREPIEQLLGLGSIR